MDLREQNVNDEDMEIVVREAVINKQCKKLELSNNQITSVGVSIRIGVNKLISNSSADVLVEMLKQNQTLGCLDIIVPAICLKTGNNDFNKL